MLQDEFLRIQQEIEKTIVFVTHDIDEAIKMGDHIAILGEGGVLAQYDTPENILAEPASEFVASFVGTDRTLKRLSLTRVAEAPLEPLNGSPAGSLPRISGSLTLREALSELIGSGSERGVVYSEEEPPEDRGEISLDTIRHFSETSA
jgi:osmoprotectant transport system ATP-binding protein